jgi:4-carboxymuconolactone decarboxylase
MPRIPKLDVAGLSPAQRRVHDAIAAGPRGMVAGPLAVWLESAPLADKAQALGAFCRYETSLPPRLSELAILITGAYWAAGYEWHTHAPLAIAAGIAPAAVEAIRAGQPPVLAGADEQAVYDFAHELLHTHQVSDATYQRVVTHLSQQGAVELVGILGYYALISMTIKAFAVAVPDGATEPFAAP